MKAVKGCLVALLGALLGGFIGGAGSMALSYAFLAGDPEFDALTWIAIGIFFGFIGMVIGMGVALWLVGRSE